MALKFSFNKLRTAVSGFLTGTDTAGASLEGGEEAIFVPKLRTARRIVDWNAALTLTSADSGSWIYASDATAGILTLPAAQAGMEFNIFIAIAQTGDTHITVPSGYFIGGLLQSDADTSTENLALWLSDGNSNDWINLDSDAKGRLAGGHIHIVCDGTNWHVKGVLNATGTIATPFADAES